MRVAAGVIFMMVVIFYSNCIAHYLYHLDADEDGDVSSDKIKPIQCVVLELCGLLLSNSSKQKIQRAKRLVVCSIYSMRYSHIYAVDSLV